ncbi:protein disulfide-isomerase TMX3 [Lingula anatina]|uniref:Protein disulfide-isomerase TMX3 n=1 Tax=Lingula anatina TaxID=7574 RepID=A0A1S3K797_LINAN|nr:protein disulfide-isomerase TMX3 [Lingula anatina]|eukprot:XP_013418505.1 protein disulfide-isomerase TMX3 [Lingula anatina]
MTTMEKWKWSVIAVLGFLGAYVSASVLNLDERFLEQKKDGSWLVEFYAPWCGHCKKLEPIFTEVGLALRHTGIRVAKLDGTAYSSVMHAFEVRGFPTIKFIKGDKNYTFTGDRTKEDIVQFAKKADGPGVRFLSSLGKFREAKSEHKDEDTVFFVYVGNQDPQVSALLSAYKQIAQERKVQTYFYAGEIRILPEEIKASLKAESTVIVFKDDTYEEYEVPAEPTKQALDAWINKVRFHLYPKVGGPAINEMASTGKMIVIAVIDSAAEEELTKHNRVKEVVKTLALRKNSDINKQFQFAWMGDNEVANDITMWYISMPNLIVLDPSSRLYFMPNFSVVDITIGTLEAFLENVHEGKIPAKGGTGFLQRVQRILYEIISMFISVWMSSRLMFFLIFVLPGALISIVCYAACGPPSENTGDEESDEGDYGEVDMSNIEEDAESLLEDCDPDHLKSE